MNAQRYVVKRKSVASEITEFETFSPRAAATYQTTSGPVDAIASDAIRIFLGRFGATSGMIRIQTHSQGTPRNTVTVIGGNPRQNSAIEMPKAPTTAKTSPTSRNRCGDIRAYREITKTTMPSRIDPAAKKFSMIAKGHSGC